MLEKDKLRQTDMYSGTVIFLLGLWIIRQALKMPMKDSWGGVQNVWYVSPAIFPLLVGAVISLLGAVLIRTAAKEVGWEKAKMGTRWLFSPKLAQYLRTPSVMRFYTSVCLLFSYVFLHIPRVDFFVCTVLFLVVFITIFYFDDDALLKKLLVFYLAGTLGFVLYLIVELPDVLEPVLSHPSDWLALAFTVAYCIYAWILVRQRVLLRKKFRIALILAVVAPFFIGPIFKYLLMVPMPKEGLVVMFMDAVWYWDF